MKFLSTVDSPGSHQLDASWFVDYLSLSPLSVKSKEMEPLTNQFVLEKENLTTFLDQDVRKTYSYIVDGSFSELVSNQVKGRTTLLLLDQ